MSVSRSATLAGLAISVAALLSACSAASPGGGTDDAATVTLPRVATLVSYPPLPSGLEEGLFDDAFGTDASSMQVDYVASGTDGVQSLAAGHSDIVIGGYDPAALANAPDVRIVGISETSPDTHALLVAPGSDIESIEDLEGRTVGGYSASLTPFLALMLENAGLPSDYIDYIQVPSDGGLAALTSGAIDAWYTWDPFFAQAEIQDLARPVVTGSDFYLNPIVIMTTQSYLDENEESLQAFLSGYIASTEWVNENTDDAAAYLAEATGMSAEAAEATIARRDYDVVPASPEATDWMVGAGEAQLDLGMITSVPDLDAMIDPAPLDAVLAG